jgi:hypothetical protein
LYVNVVYCIGNKPVSISPPFTFGKDVATRNLDARYLVTGKPIDEDARLRALNIFLADFVIDTGELKLDVGRIPGEGEDEKNEKNDSEAQL